MPLQLHDLQALDDPLPGAAGGTPMQLPLDAIDEDPDQPRREFDADALQELADTIRARGVRQPVSVRPHADQRGRWVLNFGARRLRASRIAGLTQIPAFIDASADNYDQVIENEQREGLKPLELALFVQKRLALGESQSEIARRMGKSRAYVTYATALVDAPDWLLSLYRQGRCQALHALYELRRLHQEHPQHVEAWVADRAVISRSEVDALRAELAGDARGAAQPGASKPVQPMDGPDARNTASPAAMPAATATALPALPDIEKPTGRCLVVEKDGQDYELLLFAVPAEAGHVYVRPMQGGSRREERAAELTLRGFVVR